MEDVVIIPPKQEYHWVSLWKGLRKILFGRICNSTLLQKWSQWDFFLFSLDPVRIHFLTLGWTAPLKSALEPDKGLDNLIKVESKPVYDKISPWTLFVLLFYDCIKSGRKREDARATHRHYCCFHHSFFPNVSIIGTKCACSVKYNSLWFSVNTTTKLQATEIKATLPGWRTRGTWTTASWAALSLSQDCKLRSGAISSCTNWQTKQRWSNRVIKVTRLHNLVLLTLTCQLRWCQCCEFLPCLGRVRFHASLQRLSGMWTKPFAVSDWGKENVFPLCTLCVSWLCGDPDGRLVAFDYVAADLLCVWIDSYFKK